MCFIMPHGPLTDEHKTIHLRTTTKAGMRQKQVYDVSGIKPHLIGKYKTIIDNKSCAVGLNLLQKESSKMSMNKKRPEAA